MASLFIFVSLDVIVGANSRQRSACQQNPDHAIETDLKCIRDGDAGTPSIGRRCQPITPMHRVVRQIAGDTDAMHNHSVRVVDRPTPMDVLIKAPH